MNYSKLPQFLLSLFVTTSTWASEVTLHAPELSAEDGDTVLAMVAGKQQKIQLQGIDAPEDTNNPKFQFDLKRTGLSKEELLTLGQSSTEFLARLLILNSPFTLHYNPDKKDRYGRAVGVIKNQQGQSVNELMVINGYAVSTEAKSDEQLNLNELEQQAKEEKNGLWQYQADTFSRWARKK
ncbi:thermonuclease family protein [candidate division KSB1 bacterium]|nr:thermonuclease family protein [candidate division KSB1 bacterium]